MSEINLFLQEQKSQKPKKLVIKHNESLKLFSFNDIFSKKFKINIIIPKSSSKIIIHPSSMKNIFSLNQLNYNEYLNLKFAEENVNTTQESQSLVETLVISKNKNVLKKMSEEIEKMFKRNQIKKDINEQKNQKEKDPNIFDPDFPLLSHKIINTFSNIDNFPRKYLSLIICGNKAIINLDYLKCIYPTIFCCGVFNFLYFINILFTINTELNLSFHYFIYIPLAFLLIFTGVYGYKKVKKNIYDNEFCITLTNICAISPIFSFALSWIYKQEIAKSQLITNFLINFLSCSSSFCCIIILKEAERMKNCEKEIIIQN